MAKSDTRLQFLLALSPVFQGRVEMTLLKVAGDVFVETGKGDAHVARVAYAQRVLNNPAQMAQVAAPFLAQSGNIAPTIEDTDDGVRTTVVDAALFSQVNSSWDALAGVDSGN